MTKSQLIYTTVTNNQGIKRPVHFSSEKMHQKGTLQDFSHPWTNEMLYKKYGLDKDEIAFIESMIRPME